MKPHPGKWKVGDRARVSTKAPEYTQIMFGSEVGEVVAVDPHTLSVVFGGIRLTELRDGFRKVTW